MKKSKILIIAAVIVFLIIFGIFFCDYSNKSKNADTEIQAHSEEISDAVSNEMSDCEELSFEASDDSESDVSDGAMIIKTYEYSYKTANFNSSVESFEDTVRRFRGYVSYSEIYGDEDNRTAIYRARIPSQLSEDFVSDLSGIGELISSSSTAEDVTLSYSEMSTHVETLRTEYENLQGMIADATDLDTIITLESRMSDILYDIENYESQMTIISNQVEYSTVNLTIEEEIPEPEEPEKTKIEKSYSEKISEKFEGSVSDISDLLKDLGLWFASALPYIVIIIVVGLIALFVVFFVRKFKNKKVKKQ